MTKDPYSESSARVLDVFPLSVELQEAFKKLFSLIDSASSILISSTLTSDGDSIGAQLGLYRLIQERRKQNPPQMTIVNERPVPARYQFLSNTDQILSFSSYEELKEKPKFDLGITCDGGVERTGVVQQRFSDIPNIILIDHHAVGSQLNYSAKLLDLNSSSTCEMIYNLFEFAGIPVTKEVAELLYVGIVFDTGFFKHSLTTPRTHHVAAELVRTGIDFSKISDRAILERTWAAQLLLKRLLDNMEISSCGRLIHSYWSKRDLDEVQFQDGDQEGMINQLYYTEGALVVALFVEPEPGRVRLSFRSKGDFDVANFARQLNPQGGGHIRAAGCALDGKLHEVRKLVIQKLMNALSD